MASLTKIVGKVDLSGISDEVKDQFFKKGHVTMDTGSGVHHSLKDMVGRPIGIRTDDSGTYLLVRLYDGPDNSVQKALALSKVIKEDRNGSPKFEFKLYKGRLETYPGSDEWNDRMTIAVAPNKDPELAIKLAPQKLGDFTFFPDPPAVEVG